MKKMILMAAIAILGAASVSAQVEKPKAGTFGLEVQMNPFDQNGKMFKLDGLKARYFLNDKEALRLKLGFDVTKVKTEADDNFLERSTSGNISLNAGYEFHFNLAKRLSAYVGGQIGVSRHFASSETNNSDNHWVRTSNAAGADRANWGFNIDALTGLDFYIYHGLYIGTELGLGVQSTKTSKVTVTKNELFTGETTVEDNSTTRSTTAGITIQPVLRLGWNF